MSAATEVNNEGREGPSVVKQVPNQKGNPKEAQKRLEGEKRIEVNDLHQTDHERRSGFKPLEGLHDLSTKTITYWSTAVLGEGAYAAVYKAKCEELPCAVKILHGIIQRDPRLTTFIESFNRECEYLKNIRHPNIVQYLGLCRDPQTHHPALLMELMDQSLRHFLESSSDRLAPRIEVSICHDTALALTHLHSIGIVHRDLSSNNVLLIGAGSRAKVCDFGMSKVIDASRNQYITPLTSLTQCPGALVYMPPEALVEIPTYSQKIDCFSFGVLSIEIMTRLFPNPTARTKMVESTTSLTGWISLPVLETECRKDHINKIDQSHPLLGIVLACLEMKEEKRPSARELCELIEEVRLFRVVDASTIPDPLHDDHTTAVKIDTRSQKYAELEAINQNQKEKITSLFRQLEEISSTSNARIAELCSIKQNQEMKIASLLKTKSESPSRIPPDVYCQSLHISGWKVGKPAPFAVAQRSTTVKGHLIFCAFYSEPNHVVCCYDVQDNSWSELPRLNSNNFLKLSLFVNEGELLYTLQGSNGELSYMLDGTWYKAGRCDSSTRKSVACVYHNEFVIIICVNNPVRIYNLKGELMHICTGPDQIENASASICNDGMLYLAGIKEVGGVWTERCIRVSLSQLFQKRTFLGFTIVTTLVWQVVSPLPVTRCTCVSYREHLIIVGGYAKGQACNTIFCYNEIQNSWDLVGHMPTSRYNCLVEVVNDQLIVIGGWINHFKACDTVEICTLELLN